MVAVLLGVFPTADGSLTTVRHNARLMTSWCRSPDGLGLPEARVLRLLDPGLSSDTAVERLDAWLDGHGHVGELVVFAVGRIGPLARPVVRALHARPEVERCHFFVDCSDADQLCDEYQRLVDRGEQTRPTTFISAHRSTAGRSVLGTPDAFASVLVDVLRTGDSSAGGRLTVREIYEQMVRRFERSGHGMALPRLNASPSSLADLPLFPNPAATPARPRPAPSRGPERRPEPGSSARWLWGLAAACVLGLGLGVFLSPYPRSQESAGRPDLGETTPIRPRGDAPGVQYGRRVRELAPARVDDAPVADEAERDRLAPLHVPTPRQAPASDRAPR